MNRDDFAAAVKAADQSVQPLLDATITDIREHTGLSRAAFCRRYLLPLRTVEDWERGVSACPLYTRLMLAEITGFAAENKIKIS